MASTVTITLGGLNLRLLRKDYLLLVSRQPLLSETIFSMFSGRKKKSPSGAMWCLPAQQKLAEWIGVCRETINRGVGFLRDTGFIATQWREPRNGFYQTLLYIPGPVLRKALSCASACIQSFLNRVTPKSHISSNKDKISSSEVAKRSKPTKINDPPLHDVITRIENMHPELAT